MIGFLTQTLSSSWQQAMISFGELGPEHLAIVLSIALLEALLSVDNALVIASLARQLPAHQEKRAIAFGIGAGVFLRVIALFFAAIIIKYTWIKLMGAAYLIWLAWRHLLQPLLFAEPEETGDYQGARTKTKFFDVVLSIALADMAFSIDNVVAAVGMSTNFAVVILGVTAGIFTMIFATQLVAVLMKSFPSLEKAAYAIVGLIGVFIFAEELTALHLPEMAKFSAVIAIVVLTMVYDAWFNKRNKP